MKHKRLIITIVIVLIVIAAAVAWYSRPGTGGRAAQKSPVFVNSAPASTEYPQPDGILFSFSSVPVIPASMPVYAYTAIGAGEAEKIADGAALRLGLSSVPSIVKRGPSYIKTWETERASLVFSVSGDNVSYIYQLFLAGPEDMNVSAEVAATDLFAMFNKTPVSTEISDASNGPFDGVLILDPSPVIPLRGLSFIYTIGGVPVAAEKMNLSAGSVILDKNGAVRQANINPALVVTLQQDVASVIAPDQILFNLAQKRGTILGAGPADSPETGRAPSFKSFLITKTQLCYSPANGVLLPAFILSGVGTGADGNKQSASFFLWGFPAKPQP